MKNSLRIRFSYKNYKYKITFDSHQSVDALAEFIEHKFLNCPIDIFDDEGFLIGKDEIVGVILDDNQIIHCKDRVNKRIQVDSEYVNFYASNFLHEKNKFLPENSDNHSFTKLSKEEEKRVNRRKDLMQKFKKFENDHFTAKNLISNFKMSDVKALEELNDKMQKNYNNFYAILNIDALLKEEFTEYLEKTAKLAEEVKYFTDSICKNITVLENNLILLKDIHMTVKNKDDNINIKSYIDRTTELSETTYKILEECEKMGGDYSPYINEFKNIVDDINDMAESSDSKLLDCFKKITEKEQRISALYKRKNVSDRKKLLTQLKEEQKLICELFTTVKTHMKNLNLEMKYEQKFLECCKKINKVNMIVKSLSTIVANQDKFLEKIKEGETIHMNMKNHTTTKQFHKFYNQFMKYKKEFDTALENEYKELKNVFSAEIEVIRRCHCSAKSLYGNIVKKEQKITTKEQKEQKIATKEQKEQKIVINCSKKTFTLLEQAYNDAKKVYSTLTTENKDAVRDSIKKYKSSITSFLKILKAYDIQENIDLVSQASKYEEEIRDILTNFHESPPYNADNQAIYRFNNKFTAANKLIFELVKIHKDNLLTDRYKNFTEKYSQLHDIMRNITGSLAGDEKLQKEYAKEHDSLLKQIRQIDSLHSTVYGTAAKYKRHELERQLKESNIIYKELTYINSTANNGNMRSTVEKTKNLTLRLEEIVNFLKKEILTDFELLREFKQQIEDIFKYYDESLLISKRNSKIPVKEEDISVLYSKVLMAYGKNNFCITELEQYREEMHKIYASLDLKKREASHFYIKKTDGLLISCIDKCISASHKKLSNLNKKDAFLEEYKTFQSLVEKMKKLDSLRTNEKLVNLVNEIYRGRFGQQVEIVEEDPTSLINEIKNMARKANQLYDPSGKNTEPDDVKEIRKRAVDAYNLLFKKSNDKAAVGKSKERVDNICAIADNNLLIKNIIFLHSKKNKTQEESDELRMGVEKILSNSNLPPVMMDYMCSVQKSINGKKGVREIKKIEDLKSEKSQIKMVKAKKMNGKKRSSEWEDFPELK